MSEYKFPHGTYKDNMERFLEQFKDDETILARFKPEDVVCHCSKATFYTYLNEYMPLWFLTSCQTFKLEDGVCEPVFCRIQQAAWNAALSEYFKDKAEWCAKHGCE